MRGLPKFKVNFEYEKKQYEQKLAEEINALKDVNLKDIDDDKDIKIDIDDVN